MRKRLSLRASRKNFKRTARKIHAKNLYKYVARGGYRL